MRLTKKRYTFMIDPDLEAAVKQLKVRDGVSEGETVRRALRAYLAAHGVLPGDARQVARKRVRARSRA